MSTNLVVAEVRKVITLRFWWALLIPSVIIAMCASAIYASVAEGFSDLNDDMDTGPGSVGIYVALAWVMLVAGIFGAMNAGTEYRHKTLTPTFLTASGRDEAIAAKLLVTAFFAVGYALLVELISLLGMLTFGARFVHLGVDMLQILALGVFAVVCWSMIGAGLGLLLGSPIGSALALVAWAAVGELTIALIAFGLGFKEFGSFFPASATLATLARGDFDGENGFVDWPLAPIVLLLWAAVVAGAGWWVTRQRDIT